MNDPNISNILQQLRDIHLPQPISVWPLAPGWYVTAVIVGILVVVLGAYLYRVWRRLKRRRTILRELHQLKSQQGDRETAEIIADLSGLLKRVAIYCFPKHAVAGLIGKAWLQFLNDKGRTQDFSQTEGELLVSAAYQKSENINPEKLFVLVEKWIRRNL